MATIKPIEARTIHQIQSGQVIVDLCSVVKELLENSIDAGATSIDVRFRNQGLDAIEVQDNGSGISPENYETIGLKHYTSKLSCYSDLATLQTFGFRGEALSSLCALSRFSIVTCLAKDVPKGTKLDFKVSGKLKGTHVVASQKGTHVIVETLFHNLPVRRRELERNIKREWNKAISLLNQYACIQTGVKITVSQQPSKGKRVVLFSTKGNPTTRENIVNIFGTKTMAVLVKLDMDLEFTPTDGLSLKAALEDRRASTEVCIRGYVSRPAHGEGRQTPDRQMFFVNGRPCGLPQFAKVFNEVYRAYNASQSPFIFADIQLETHLYDVNVSPDKRTILLHDQSRMLENLKGALISLFKTQDYSIPMAQSVTQKPRFGTQKTACKRSLPEDKQHITSQSISDAANILHIENACLGEEGKQGEEEEEEERKEVEEEDEEDEAGDEEHDGSVPRQSRSLQKVHAAGPKKLTAAELRSQSLISHWIGTKAERRGALGENKELEHQAGLARHAETSPAVRSEAIVSERQSEGFEGRSSSPARWSGTHSVTTKEMPRRVLDFNSRLAEVYKPDKPNLHTTDISRLKDAEDAEQAEIPAFTPTKAPQSTQCTPMVESRLHNEADTNVATVTIGYHAATGSRASQPRGHKAQNRPEPAQVRSISPPRSATSSTPFGSRLTRMLSAAQSSDQRKQTPALEFVSATKHNDTEDGVSEASDCSTKNRVSDATGTSSPGEESAVIPESSAKVPEPVHSLLSFSREATADHTAHDSQVGETTTEDAGATLSRSHALWVGGKRKDAIFQFRQNMKMSEGDLKCWGASWLSGLGPPPRRNQSIGASGMESSNAEEVLSLIISKSDFRRMTIVGQFNLGFIIAVRHASRADVMTADDELFIIDQHASDEKYNFERLQSTTVVQSQRLVHPKQLELTALEEEIVMENIEALNVNGFKVDVDVSGNQPVGLRCRLLALPLSRETTFTLSDLEELISLLGDHDHVGANSAPRPSKVRSMFAMRACRSSVMIGKALAKQQMERLVRHMGELDKPWNCPHGRPTMRHLSGLGAWDNIGWKEAKPRVSWAKYASG
ncbi:DNA mismatch repair protein pms2 [Colletotrichum plurivorum]|uniref:DNA mismatch repair protein PMS1 n=1 Tax=Colletotrichum plurivorum TaxID=2175906 RepID=A0A8H6JJ26_9PEZI|nr:DNA mismatch repair protein pms2 [Colletotrichum plurivorum]